ncbi:hypothetical protein BMS3Bbin10_00239 [bacterium BMS3Bbin10]|nr:hypothetical protein BMS3Bbin10_00239 [bacterium BMS3Bbin10]
MPPRFLAHAASILPAIALAAGLGACTGPVYFAEQLKTIPVPGPVLMKSLSDPDCRLQPRLAVATDKEKPKYKTAGPDFENDYSGTSKPETSLAKETASTPANAGLKDMQNERDCYRRAEQVAREHLNELQASATDTVVALDRVKHRLNAKSFQPL